MLTLTENQQLTILSYIEAHTVRVNKHLCDMQMLDENGTPTSWNGHDSILNWFLDSISGDNYEIVDGEVCLEIDGSDSHNGCPILFEFEAKEFGLDA